MDTRSLDEKKAQAVVDEIKAAGGDALAVGGDVGADDFPEKVIGATIKCVSLPTSPSWMAACGCGRARWRGLMGVCDAGSTGSSTTS